MDKDLLREKGLNPQNVKRAYLTNYQLKIGEKATLVPKIGASSYGTVMELDSIELQILYGSDGVKDYIPQSVHVKTMNGEPLEAISYILPIEKISGSNSQYATKLASIAKKLNLPDLYINEIKGWI